MITIYILIYYIQKINIFFNLYSKSKLLIKIHVFNNL